VTARFVLSPRAVRDLDAIWSFTVERWGSNQASTYLHSIESAANRVCEAPNLGRPIDFIRKGYFTYPVGSHCLFYRLTSEGIEIIRILHQRMDLKRHL
jgi:toxin ParE1/3/4